MEKSITYRSGYKYQLAETFSLFTGLLPDKAAISDFISLQTTGLLGIKKGYAWDGPSGPTIDTKNFMRGSLVHDALYQLIREKKLHKDFRWAADDLLRKICLEDGMSSVRAWWVYMGVRFGGGPAADPKSDKKVYRAP